MLLYRRPAALLATLVLIVLVAPSTTGLRLVVSTLTPPVRLAAAATETLIGRAPAVFTGPGVFVVILLGTALIAALALAPVRSAAEAQRFDVR